jgi:hypothetical protein
MSRAAIAFPHPEAFDAEVQEALDLDLCQGDPMKALRVTLIANAFLEAEIDQLKAEVSAGYSRCKVKRKV